MFELRNFAIQTPIPLKSENFMAIPGQKIALIGPSGGGKSTFLKALAGFVPCPRASFSWNGVEFAQNPPHQRPVSVLFQSHNLFMHLDAYQNMALGLDAKLKLNEAQKKRVLELAKKLEIDTVLTHRPRALSGGQAARVALARIILQAREIVLFDEPFSALGPAQIERIERIIDEELVRPERLIFFVSHQVEQAFSWSDQLMWLDHGHVNAPKPVKEFWDHQPQGAIDYFGKNTTFRVKR